MHNGFVNVDNEKMSKSLGNFFTIRDVLEVFDAETLRFFVVRSHYRSPLNYSDVHLGDARSSLKRLYTTLASVTPQDMAIGEIDWSNSYAERFKKAMNEDFSTPEAVSVLFDLSVEVNKSKDPYLSGLLKALGSCLGILESSPSAFLKAGASVGEPEIEKQIHARAQAKKEKNFALADEIRKALLDQGIVLKDSAQGTTWEKVN
jgi:cysteinyl-tRNA synthetase